MNIMNFKVKLNKLYQENISEYQHSIPPLPKPITCMIKFNTSKSNRQSTEYHNVSPIYEEESYEVHEPLVIPLPDASSEPNTVMIEVHNTVIAYITVRSPLRPEYHTCLAELEAI
jgi:hypothetical protein